MPSEFVLQQPDFVTVGPASAPAAIDVGAGIWCSPGMSSAYLITTAEGRIAVNTGMRFEAKTTGGTSTPDPHRRPRRAAPQRRTAGRAGLRRDARHSLRRRDVVGARSNPRARGRLFRCRQDSETQIGLMPLLTAMYHQHPGAIEEEIELQDLDFASYTLERLARVPAWRDFYLGLDQTAHYAYLKRVLQVLTFQRGPNRWVLKSPQHLEQIPGLLAAFTDATFVVTHRDPASVIASAVTMLAYGDRMRRTTVAPQELAEYWVARVDHLLRVSVRDHHLLPPDRTVDVLFHEFMADVRAQFAYYFDHVAIAAELGSA